MKTFGVFLREKRKLKNITQRELAESLGYCSGQYISNIERGLANFPNSALKKLVQKLEISKEEILNQITQEILNDLNEAFSE